MARDMRPRQIFDGGWHARCLVDGCAFTTDGQDGYPTKREAEEAFRSHECADSHGKPLEA